MKQYKNMTELMSADEAIYTYYKDVLKQIEKEIGEPFEQLFKESFENSLGGDVFIIERFDDLCHIQTNKEDINGKWMTLLQTADSFDVCEWIGDYVYIFYATNNAGGPSFWVPKSIVEESGFLRDSIEKTKKAWE